MSEFSKINTIQPSKSALDSMGYPKYFNLYFDIPHHTLSCFMAQNIEFNINRDDVLNKIANIFDTHPEVECVYTDNISVYKEIEHRIYYPSAAYNVFDKININTPICCRTHTKIRFNEQLEHLYYLDFLRKIAKVSVVWHIAEPLFKIHMDKQESIEQDLRILNGNK